MTSNPQKITRWKDGFKLPPDQFAEWLRLSRLTLSFTQTEFAGLVGILPPEYIEYERGFDVPCDELMEKIIGTIGLQLMEVVCDDG